MESIIITIILLLLVTSIIFNILGIFRRKKKEDIDSSELKYGRIKKQVHCRESSYAYKEYHNITAKVKFVEFLGGRKVKIKYVELLNNSENNYFMSELNTNHNMVEYDDVEWIRSNDNRIELTHEEFFTILEGNELKRNGKIILLDSKVTSNEILDYISNK